MPRIATKKFTSRDELVVDEMQKPLGEGGFGRALLARCKATSILYVLKEVNLTKLKNKAADENRQRLIEIARSEYESTRRFKHPNIVSVFGCFEEAGDQASLQVSMYYMVLEYCEGGDLGSVIATAKANNEPFSELQLAAWAQQLSSAVRFLHRNNHVHRDIKPGNFFLTSDKATIKLGDFGLAKGHPDANSLVGVGTHLYSAPEFFSGMPYTHKSDVWSLGVSFYQMANLKLPFKALPNLVALAVLRDEPAEFADTCPADFRQLILAMLTKDPDQRPSMNEVYEMPFIVNYKMRMEQEQVKRAIESVSSSGSSPLNDAPPMPPEVAADYESILTSNVIPETLRQPIYQRLRQHLVVCEQLKTFAEDAVKAMFPEIGLFDAVQSWRREEKTIELTKYTDLIVSYAFDVHEKVKGGNLAGLKTIFQEIAAKVPTTLYGPALLKPLVDHKDPNDSCKTALIQAAENNHLKVVQYLLQEHDADPSVRDATDAASMAIHVAAGRGFSNVVSDLLSARPELLAAEDGNGLTALDRAVMAGRLQMVKFLCEEKHVDIERHHQGTGRTPLLHACAHNHVDILDYLIDRGANLSAQSNGETLASYGPHITAENGFLELTVLLLLLKPDLLEAKNIQNETPLNRAANSDRLAIVKFLVEEKKANIENCGFRGRTPLLDAAAKGFMDVVEYLVAKGANVDAIDSLSGDNGAHLAAMFDYKQTLEYFLRLRPNFLTAPNFNQLSPLALAVAHGKFPIVRFLIEEMKAPVDVRTQSGKSLLHLAAIAGQLDMAQYLLQKGADVKAKTAIDDSGSLAIHLAAEMGRQDMVEHFLQVSPDLIEAKNKNNDTPLCRAAAGGHLELVRFLVINKRANIENKGFMGRTPMALAAIKGSQPVVAFLLSQGANLKTVDTNDGDMPIHLAAYVGHTEVVRCFLDHPTGGRQLINMLNKKGHSPLYYARKQNKHETVRLLEERLIGGRF